jgi:hypothetical protein
MLAAYGPKRNNRPQERKNQICPEQWRCPESEQAMRDQELTSATETDILKTALQFRASSVTASECDKEAARQMLARLYPTELLKPADPKQ